MSQTTLFIAAHGTERNEDSRQAAERQANLLRRMGVFAAVHAVFMEEEPFIRGCEMLAPTRNVIVVPFFISDGLHVQEDIPVLLGAPKGVVKERLAAGLPAWRNPTEKGGKLVWCSSSVGGEPHIPDIIVQLVEEAAGPAVLRGVHSERL